MSSDGSSGITQFGLYRTIDARTEEFLRLSRKRQIRQGCACAAVSTAITVTVVVVILLIYEYGIAVEWSLVQNRRVDNNAKEGNIYDQPIADRLDRSYFGFDQDYYERMPLLVNAMQENSYLDPTLEVIPASKHNNHIHNLTTPPKNYRTNDVRRTSPRPFFFEYRSPTPLPFSKRYGSRTWVEKYRNAQRLQNIRQIIKYLEKTINAKVGDMHTKTPSTHIAFTGMYVEPMINVSEGNGPKTKVDLVLQSTVKSEISHSNHQSDPLFLFKPENPGEVNLLADGFLRFSPVPTPIPEISTIPPYFKTMSNSNNCFGHNCEEKTNSASNVVHTTELPSTTKSFSVMLNLFPLKSATDVGVKSRVNLNKSQVNLNKIYFTTSRPTAHFKRKPTVPIRRTFIRRKSRILYQNNTKTFMKNNTVSLDIDKNDQEAAGTNMIVHVKVYSPDIKTEANTKQVPDDTTTEPFKPILIEPTQPYSTETPLVLSTSQVEDFHVGSSGIIPIQDRTTTPPLPKVTTMLPFFETTVIPEVNSFTSPSDILKFNHEDAKIPQEYIKLRNRDAIANRRNFREDNDEDNANTHIVTSKNEVTKTTTMEATIETTEEFEDTTTVQTYVPQINGHYRTISQNLRALNITPESSRKRRLELVISGFRKPTYVPMYVEIKRNNTVKSGDDE
ncbi:uncharacterized protein LOC115454947 [Manduca sexta]|uniref:uncharacterized protein LOC115454947 n=2 Tax=Manduca sexta TaxID=7130 RepID=UPI0018903923|nr:uncharacterized protein LOC115454947 [Manduca sexta]